MKKLFFIAAAAMVIGLVACDKKKDTPPTPPIGGTELKYTEPVLLWGEGPATVVNSITEPGRLTIWTFQGDDFASGVGTEGKDDVYSYTYLFDGEVGVYDANGQVVDLTDNVPLVDVLVHFQVKHANAVKAYADKNYTYVATEEGVAVYQVDANTIVGYYTGKTISSSNPIDAVILDYIENVQGRSESSFVDFAVEKLVAREASMR